MSDFRTKSERFMRVDKQLLETHYEGVLRNFAPQLFPMWHMARWSPLVDGPAGRAKPDEILVKNDFSDWLVVEVELADHPESHFEAQFSALADANYLTDRVIESALETLKDLDGRALEQMLTDVRPGMLCIADSQTQALEWQCRTNGFSLAVITPLRSDKGTWAMQQIQMPRMLIEQAPGLGDFDLRVVNTMGSHVFCELPRNFPPGKESFVRVADVLHSFKQFTFSDSNRQALIPKEVALGRRNLKLRLVDPDQNLFDLLD